MTRRLAIVVTLQRKLCNDGEHQRDKQCIVAHDAIAHGVTTCGVVVRDVELVALEFTALQLAVL
jgi:hypothetical protein